MSDLQKNLTAAGASAESAEKIAGIIKAAAQASALTPVELNRCLRIGADEARRIYYWEKKHAPLLPAGGGERLKEIKNFLPVEALPQTMNVSNTFCLKRRRFCFCRHRQLKTTSKASAAFPDCRQSTRKHTAGRP